MRRGSFVPGARRTWVGLDTPAGVQQIAEHHLRLGQLLFGGLVAPGKGLFVVLVDPSPLASITARLYCATRSPCSAARRYHFVASARSTATPCPVQYMTAICSCAPVWPCSAASRNQTEAISALRAMSPPRR